MSKPSKSTAKNSGNIYIGIGGWTFEPWRGVFYPEKLTQAKELSYAASKLTSIEINGTYYGSQKPESFRKWAREVPDGFVFSLKGPRFATNRRVLAEAGNSVKRFYDSGVLELGDRLGPVLWQFAPTKKFDEADFGKFLELLPRKLEGRALRHVVEVRHDSFCVPEFIALLRKFETPVVFAEHGKYPAIADVVSDFVYARLQKGNDELKTCYPPKQLDAWAKRFQAWADRRRARRPAARRQGQAEEDAARRVRLRHPRRQGARAGGRNGTDRAREVIDVASIQLDAGLADQLGPALVFGGDESVELVVRQVPHLSAALLKTFLEFGQRGADFPAQFCDHVRRRFGGREYPEPGIDIEAGHAGFRHRRHVRRQRAALRRQHRNALRLA